MKKPKLFLLLLLTLCMSHLNVSAQKSNDSSEDVSFYLEGAVPEVDGKVVFSKEFSIPGLSQNVVYERALKWLERRMKENENDKSFVSYTDASTGVIAGAAEEWLVFKSNALTLDRAWMGYKVRVECGNEICRASIEKIRYLYEEKEKSTAEEMITDKIVLNKAKTKMSNIGLRKWRIKTVDFANDMFEGLAKSLGTDEETEAAEKAAAEKAKKAKKSKNVVINTTASSAATTDNSEVEVIKSVQPLPVAVIRDGEETKVAETSVTSSELKEIDPASVSKDAIKIGEGKLVIVIGEGDPFNMSIITANAGGSIGKVNNAPVVFSILSPDQSYDAIEKADTYKVKFYPTDSTTPSLILDCKKVEGPTPFEGQPRTYIGAIQKAWSK